MGWNTSLIIRNDCLHDIENDPAYGKKVADAVKEVIMQDRGVNVHCGSCGASTTVIETHHADATAIIAVGGNTARVLGYTFLRNREEFNEDVLRDLALQHGFTLRKTSR